MLQVKPTSNPGRLTTIVGDIPRQYTLNEKRHAVRMFEYPGGSNSSRDLTENRNYHIDSRRRYSEGNFLELNSNRNALGVRNTRPKSVLTITDDSPSPFETSTTRYIKAQIRHSGFKTPGSLDSDTFERVSRERRRASSGIDRTTDFNRDPSYINSAKSSRGGLSLNADFLPSVSRIDPRPSSEIRGHFFGDTTTSKTTSVPNKVRQKSGVTRNNEDPENGGKRLRNSGSGGAVEVQISRPVSVLTISEAEPSPFATLDIPVELLHGPATRVRRVLSPVVICLLIVALLASLAVAVYFAVVLKDTQEKQIEFLQVILKLRLARDDDDDDTSNLKRLTASEQEELTRAYCTQINQFYRTSQLSANYRGCEVKTLTDEVIEFRIYLLDNPKTEMLTGHVIDILATRAPKVGQKGSKLRKISGITVDISNGSRSVTVEKARRPEGFYAGSGSNIIKEGPPRQKNNSNVFDHTATASPGADTTTDFIPTSTTKLHTVTSTASITRSRISSSSTTAATATDVRAETENVVEGGNSSVLNDLLCATVQPGEILPHPFVCTHYIQCEFSKAITRPCSGGLVFNPAISACVKPTPELPCTRMKPCDNLNGGYFPHPTNCNFYIVCDQGETRVQSCHSNFYWDDAIKTCVPTQDGAYCQTV